MTEFCRWVEFVACVVIAIRVITYRRHAGARYRPFYSFLAWMIVACSGAIALRIAFGVYHRLVWSDTLLTVLFCVSLVLARGNVAKAICSPFKPPKK